MIKPKIIVISGYGLNCEEETAYAFELALKQSSGSAGGGKVDIVHINDLIAEKKMLKQYQILAIPGGFSFGDDTGSGKAYANKLNNHLKNALREFAERDKLIIGICNGFQILTQTGLLPGALTFNDFPRYTVRWVDLKMTFPKPIHKMSSRPTSRDPKLKNWILNIPSDAFTASGMTNKTSAWLSGIKTLPLPIAHGEGKFYASPETLAIIKKRRQIAARYANGEICELQNLKPNPNGSMEDIAMITSENGKILGTMPHPERAIFFTQLPHWTLTKEKFKRSNKPVPKFGPGLQIFKNAINYFK